MKTYCQYVLLMQHVLADLATLRYSKKIYQSLGDSTPWGFDDSVFVVTNNSSWENGTVVCLQNTVAL
jgi:hypothetical protein